MYEGQHTKSAAPQTSKEMEDSKYRFLLIPPFRLPSESKWGYQTLHMEGERPKAERLMNADMVLPYLEGIDWDLHPGALATYGDWPVETREEFAYAANARILNIRTVCQDSRYNGVVLLGGGEPGFLEAREMCRKAGIVCTANGHSQMYLATMLGNKFSVIDIAGVHNVYYRDLIYQHQLQDRCASIRNIGMHLPRPGIEDGPQLREERQKALAGEPSLAVDRAVEQAEKAILEDGAEVITLGCSGVFWLKPYIEKGLLERGWEVPVLEGYSASIALAKLMIDLGVNASGITYMSDHPQRTLGKIVV
jgi:Asp/Glu/hydantoin racemase